MIITKTLSLSLLSSLCVASIIVQGTPGDDALIGTPESEVFQAGPGNDLILGRGGEDQFICGPGHDFAAGGGDDDLFVGGPGNDTLRGLGGDNRYFGGDGDDRIEMIKGLAFHVPNQPCPVSATFDVALGGDGDDRCFWATGIVSPTFLPTLKFCFDCGSGTFHGGEGHDTLVVGSGSFLGHSSDYVILEGTIPGFPWQLQPTQGGASLHFREVEALQFSDKVVNL